MNINLQRENGSYRGGGVPWRGKCICENMRVLKGHGVFGKPQVSQEVQQDNEVQQKVTGGKVGGVGEAR